MLSQSTETYVAWIAALLLTGGALALAGGALSLAGARRRPYFQLRRQALVRGWRLVTWGVGLLIASGLMLGFGKRGVEALVPPTLIPTASLTPTLTSTVTATPTITLTPSQTSPPTGTLTPTPTLTPSDTPTPTLSPTPALPLALITPAGTLTVTPPPEAVAADIRFSRRNDCTVKGSLEYLDQLPKTIYAHFYYDNWLPGVQWSSVWLRDGAPVYVETSLWNGSTGGCGFANYDNGKLWWPEGAYEVQIFIGERWLASRQFFVVAATPSPTFTPIPPTRTPTATRTPRPTITPTYTRTPRPTQIVSPTPTR
jgi:type VI secretion system secreted protein VgrG